MAKLIRVAALVLCVLMLLPASLAMAVSAETGMNDIIDDAGTEIPMASDMLAPEDGDDDMFGADLGEAGADGTDPAAEVADATPIAPEVVTDAPSFADIDTTQGGTVTPMAGGLDPVGGLGTPTMADLNAVAAGVISSQAADITRNCKYDITEGKLAPLSDSKLSTYWTNKNKARIRITVSANDKAGGLYIEWVKKPDDLSIIQYDDAKSEIKRYDTSSYTGLVSVFELLPEARWIDLEFEKRVGIATLRVFSQGSLPDAIQNWEAPVAKADLMVVAAHQGDEFLFFGGTIPYYDKVMDKNVEVVYMADGGRARYAEALNGLWNAGMRNSPEFLGFKDVRTQSLADARKEWNTESVLERLVMAIRRFKPEVIVSHDTKGENSQGANMMTAEALKIAVEQAADDTKFKSSADAYGVWKVSKLYLHLYPERPITMNWSQASDLLGGKTPSEVAKTGFSMHTSQQKFYTYQDGGTYDNALFGLAYTSVGDDVLKNDFFENIDEGAEKLNTEDEPSDEEADLEDLNDLFLQDEYTADELMMSDEPFDVEDEPADEVTPPVESGTPANTGNMLGLLIGAPVLLGGSALGAVAGQRYMKKKRREERRAEKNQEEA